MNKYSHFAIHQDEVVRSEASEKQAESRLLHRLCVPGKFNDFQGGVTRRALAIDVEAIFALLTGIAPREIERWYLAAYADAVEWVEMPNTLGMAVFADGGKMAFKPYASSGAYINRMSDFCAGCAYDVKKKTGPKACPFKYLYWAFLMCNQDPLDKNPPMAMPCRTLTKWSSEKKRDYLNEAGTFLESLTNSYSSLGSTHEE